MASLDGLRIRSFLSESNVARLIDDGSVALRITYKGASTSAPVISVITATSMTLTTSLGATVFTFATFSTLATLAAGINAGIGDGSAGAAGGGFSCRIMDALPTTITTASNIVVSSGLVAKNIEGEMVYDAMLDTSTTKAYMYRVAQDRNVVAIRPAAGHRVKIVNFSYYANVSAAEVGAIRIYEYNPVSGAYVLVWANVSVDATLTTTSFADCNLTAAEGRELVVMVMDTTSLTDAAGLGFLQVSYIRE